jgi:hypothetical protein
MMQIESSDVYEFQFTGDITACYEQGWIYLYETDDEDRSYLVVLESPEDGMIQSPVEEFGITITPEQARIIKEKFEGVIHGTKG